MRHAPNLTCKLRLGGNSLRETRQNIVGNSFWQVQGEPEKADGEKT